MKRFLILSSIAIVLFVSASFILTPGQKRYKDSDFAQKTTTEDVEIGITKEEKVSVYNGKINVYYYKTDDEKCETLIEYEPTDIEKRTLHLEITALNYLLNKPVPDGYKSALITATILNQFTIRNGIAYVDVSTFLKLGKGDCAFEARKRQLKETVMQFRNVTDVKFLIDGQEVQ